MSEPSPTSTPALPAADADSLVAVLRRRAAADPDRRLFTFLADGEREDELLTAAELDTRARAIGAALQQAGLQGQRALLLYPPGLEFVAAFLGCLYGGVAAVPAYPPRSNRNLPRLLAIARDARPALALTTAALAAKLGGLAAAVPELAAVRLLATDQLDPEAAAGWRDPGSGRGTLAFLQYTSGSTAEPKGVMVTHGNLLHNEEMIRQAFGQSERSVIVGWLPLYHDMGLIGNVLQPLFLGVPCVLMSPIAFLQSPRRWLAAISRYRATTSGGPNFAYDLCVRKIAPAERADLDLASWDVAFNGAEPVREETMARFAAAFAPAGFRRRAFYPCYGLAEATLFVAGGARAASGTAGATAATFDAAALERGEAVPRPSPPPGAADGPGGRTLVACGRAWAGQEIAIVDPESAVRAPAGRVGEIWLRGESVAQGYWRNREATAATFGAALAGEPASGGGWLRTGDLGFVHGGEPAELGDLGDLGDLYIAGRMKDLVIIRGRNLYPQDLEQTAERSHPAARPGCGAAFAVERDGEERLVIVQEVEVDPAHPATPASAADLAAVAEAIRRAVAEEHEVQVDRVALLRPRSIPKTSSGKIQRHAARRAFLAGTFEVVGISELPVAAPAPASAMDVPALNAEALAALAADRRRPALEAQLARWAAAALELPPAAVDPAAPLSALGLDSVTAIELRHAIETHLGVAVPLADLLEGPSLAELAGAVLAGGPADAPPAPEPLVPAARGLATHRLSYGQRAMWFLSRVAPESPAYIIAAAGRVAGEIDRPALARALEAVTARHAALRTRFGLDPSGEPVQRVEAAAEVALSEEDATSWSAGFLAERLMEEAHAPFDLERGPLLRVALWRRDGFAHGSLGGSDQPAEHLVVLSIHHIVADFWSFEVLLAELALLYRGFRHGRAAALPPLPLEYTDFAHWQERLLAGPYGERLWEFWRRELAGPLPRLTLPADRPRPSAPRFTGGACTVRLEPALAERLRAAGRSRGATLFTTLLAGYELLLARESGQEELIVGAPTSGRDSPGLAGLVGYFVNPVALRADLRGNPTGAELLARTRARVLAAFRHQELPFPLLAERLQPERDPAWPPIFQAVFVLHKAHGAQVPGLAGFALGEPGARIDLGGLAIESIALPERGAPFDLTLTMAEEEGALWASLVYSAELFDAATAARLAGHLSTLLAGLVANPERPIGELPSLAAAEAAQAAASDGHAAPQTAVEEVIAEIWRDVLGIERVGIYDGFFALGGGARELDRVLARLREVFQVALAADANGFSSAGPTVAGLAQAIAAELLAGADAATLAEILTELE
jgi:acyl-CoA synthetase (AMP-forming)/AMP-acid ligase II/acyl carrier protein